MERWLFVLICLSLDARIRGDDSLPETVRQLRREVDEMRRQRTQDQRALDALIRRCADADGHGRTIRSLDSQVQQDVADQFFAIRSGMDAMRRRLEVSDPAAGSGRLVRQTSTENAAKSLRWLLSSVKELRSDVDQIDRNLNVSDSVQRSERVHQRLDSVEKAVAELSHRATLETLERQRLAAHLLEMRQDLDLVTGRLQQLNVNISQASAQIQSLVVDANSSEPRKEMRSPQRVPLYGHLNAKYQEVKGQLETVSDKQRRLERQWRTWIEREQVETRLQLLDQLYRALAANLTVNSATLTKMEASQVTLSESVDLVQEQNELEARHLRAAVRRLQADATHAAARSDNITRLQEALNEQLTQLSADVASMEIEMEADRLALMTLQNRALNESLQRCADENRQHVQDDRIRSVQRQLHVLEEQMKQVAAERLKQPGHVIGSVGDRSDEWIVSNATSSEESSEECLDDDTC